MKRRLLRPSPSWLLSLIGLFVFWLSTPSVASINNVQALYIEVIAPDEPPGTVFETHAKAIGGTHAKAIGGTRAKAIGGTRAKAIGGTRAKAIGGTC